MFWSKEKGRELSKRHYSKRNLRKFYYREYCKRIIKASLLDLIVKQIIELQTKTENNKLILLLKQKKQFKTTLKNIMSTIE